jgi:hypothetical protein
MYLLPAIFGGVKMASAYLSLAKEALIVNADAITSQAKLYINKDMI